MRPSSLLGTRRYAVGTPFVLWCRMISFNSSISRLAAVALTALLFACSAQQSGAPQGFAPPKVTVVTLRTQPVTLTRELPGRATAYLVAEVRPQVTGLIKQRLFVEGGMVHAGQPLYQLDDSIFRAQVEGAAAALQKSKAALVAARLAAQRSAALIKIDAVSAQDDENATATLRSSEADVASNQATLDGAQVNLRYARITAPISGRIGKSAVTPGALVTADQTTALATVQQLDPIYVDVNQSSSEWLQLRQALAAARGSEGIAGTPATILFDNGSVYQHPGKLQFSEIGVDPTTGNFMLRVLVPNPEGLLLPGMYVRAQITEATLAQGLLVPQTGVTHDAKGGATALIVDAKGNAQLRTIHVARAVGTQWLVDSGLAAGERVITEGIQMAQPGKPVQAVEAAAMPAAAAAADSSVVSATAKL